MVVTMTLFSLPLSVSLSLSPNLSIYHLPISMHVHYFSVYVDTCINLYDISVSVK